MAAGSPKGCCGHDVVVEDDVVVGVDVDVDVGIVCMQALHMDAYAGRKVTVKRSRE